MFILEVLFSDKKVILKNKKQKKNKNGIIQLIFLS